MSVLNRARSGFTIVELLIVIVVIAILAAISIVAYNGIQKRALTAVLESDLGGASKQLKLFKADKGSFPATVSTNCASNPSSDTNLCINPSGGNVVDTYTSPSPHTTFSLTIIHTASGVSGTVTDSTAPATVGVADAGGDMEGVAIGSQTWAKTNVNVGTMIPLSASQTNNSVVEKYCISDDEANCSAHGGLYSWNEAMQYAIAEGAQGVCPVGWRIPSDSDWKILEIALGLTQAQANATGSRGSDQGTQLKPGGSSGLNMPPAGYRSGGAHGDFGLSAYLWSSSESGSSAWVRGLYSGDATVSRHLDSRAFGFSVRCLKD